MMNHKATALAATLGSALLIAAGQKPAPSGVFTLAQAGTGRTAYEETCGKCHTPTLMGRKGEPGELPPLSSLSASYQKFIGPRGFVPPLAGKTFIDRWGSKTAAQLVARFQETGDFFLPNDTDRETIVNITAYILQANGATAGERPLSRSTDAVVNSITVHIR